MNGTTAGDAAVCVRADQERKRVKRKPGFSHNREEASMPQELDGHMPAWPLFPSRVGHGRGEHH